MKKEELKRGMVIETRCGNRLLVIRNSDKYNSLFDLTINSYHYLTLDKYLLNKYDNECDIVKVYKDYTCSELLWERKELPQLNEIDRKQLEVFKELGFTHIKRDKDLDIWIFKDKDMGNNDFTDWFRKIFTTLEYDKVYLIEDLLKERETIKDE